MPDYEAVMDGGDGYWVGKQGGETIMAVSVDISDMNTEYNAIRVVASLEQIQSTVNSYVWGVSALCAGVLLLLVGAEHYPDISVRLSPYGILTLQKPTTPQLILQSLQLLCGTRERLRKMEQKTASIEEKMAEIRLVNRAKWLLIDREGMTEQDAHRFIEKQAMDRCVTRRAVADQVIARYQQG